MSAAGEALARLPPSVPRLRIWGPPMTAQAGGSAGAKRATSGDSRISACEVPAPIQSSSPRSSIPRRSGTALMSNSVPRETAPSFAFTSTSVPPATGRTSPVRWARSSSASSSVRGRRYRGAVPSPFTRGGRLPATGPRRGEVAARATAAKIFE